MVPQVIEYSSLESNLQSMEVTIEIGHHAAKRNVPTKEGYTHDWIVYVKLDNKEVVVKVEFNLHPSFKKPKRAVKSAPFQVIESGYGGFTMPIDVHFKINNQRRKVRFDYYLFLGETASVSNSVKEKVIFKSLNYDISSATISGVKKRSGRPKKNPQHKDISSPPSPTYSSDISPSSSSSTSLTTSSPSLHPFSSSSSCSSSSSSDNTTNNFFTHSNHNQHGHVTTGKTTGRRRQTTTLDMQSFASYIEGHPQMTSTPVKVINNASTNHTRSSSRKHLRFSPSLEECRYFSGDDVIRVTNDDNKNSNTNNNNNVTMATKPAHTVSTLPVGQFQEFVNWTDRQQYKNNKCNNSIGKNRNDDNKDRISELIGIQNKLMSLSDRKVMKEIVRLIKSAGYLQVNRSTYDFDLIHMDDQTIEAIKRYISL